MARARPPFADLGNFDIFQPGNHATVLLNADGTVTVSVDDSGDHDTFHARVCDLCPDDPPDLSEAHCVELTNVPSSNTWVGNVPVGFLDPFDVHEPTKRIVVYGVVADLSAKMDQKFRISRGGSAALPGSMSASGSITTTGSGSCGHCSDLNPVPVCLLLTYNHTITNGTSCGNCDALNIDFVLQHSDDPCLSCCWFSGSVDFCNDGNSGYWKLEKIDARNWRAEVYYSESGHSPIPIVEYNFTTGTDNECIITSQQPLDLTLNTGSVGDECSNWPSTIRFTPYMP
jgi:hypothetical protein